MPIYFRVKQTLRYSGLHKIKFNISSHYSFGVNDSYLFLRDKNVIQVITSESPIMLLLPLWFKPIPGFQSLGKRKIASRKHVLCLKS